MSNRKRRDIGDRLNAFDPNTKTDLEEFTDQIYGASEGPILDTGRVVARPTPITDIWADLAQPRRAVPASVRGDWAGDPRHVPALLEAWHTAAQTAGGIRIDPARFLEGNENTEKWPETLPALTAGYVDLLRLAATIFRDGLINPIGVVQRGRGNFLIETGERRWLAHHLLAMYRPDEGFERIAAVQGKTHDVWRQATENTARRELNAIGMARQLALLIMDVRRQEQARNGAAYDSYETLIAPGGCDRRYYAQVANGNLHRIPKGDAERIQAAMGLSEKRLADYRSLLRLTENEEINDILWIAADIEDWPDKALREIRTLPQGKVQAVLSRDGWTLEDLRALVAESKEAKAASGPLPVAPVPSFELGEAVAYQGLPGEVVSVEGDQVYVFFADGQKMWVDARRLVSFGMPYKEYARKILGGLGKREAPAPVRSTEEYYEQAPSRPATPPVQKESQAGDVPTFKVGDRIRYDGRLGTVQKLRNFGLLGVYLDGESFLRNLPAEALTSAPHEDLPPSWYEAESGAETGSDNAHSGASNLAPIPGEILLLDRTSRPADVLHYIAAISQRTATLEAIQEIEGMTLEFAQKMAEEGVLKAVLTGYYEALMAEVVSWIDDDIALFFQSIEERVNE